MKLPLRAATLLLSLIALTQTAVAQNTCSCKALDSSCTAQVNCKAHGCTSICGQKSTCHAACGKDLVLTRFSLKLVNKSAREIAAALSRQTGKNIEVIPRKDEPFNIDIRNTDMWNALDYLYKRGKVTVNGVDWREYRRLRAEISSGKMSVNFNNVSIADAISYLSFVSGFEYRIDAGDLERRFSISLQEVTLKELVAQISTQTGVRIEKAE